MNFGDCHNYTSEGDKRGGGGKTENPSGFREEVHQGILYHAVGKMNYGGFSLPSATFDRISARLDLSPFLVSSTTLSAKENLLESNESNFLSRAKAVGGVLTSQQLSARKAVSKCEQTVWPVQNRTLSCEHEHLTAWRYGRVEI